MASRLYIGTVSGRPIWDLSKGCIDHLLDFVFDQGGRDGVDYLAQMEPLCWPLVDAASPDDTVDPWQDAQGIAKARMIEVLTLARDLIARYGMRWAQDGQWQRVGQTPQEMRQLLDDAIDALSADPGNEPLLVWIG